MLLNHLPEMGLGLALLALAGGLILRSRPARLIGLGLVLLTAASAWPVLRTGQKCYDQIYYSLEPEDRAWLDGHMEEATNVKVREDLGDLDPAKGEDFTYGGWYECPPGTQATTATADELQRDRIEI